jgi:hypothetical protein
MWAHAFTTRRVQEDCPECTTKKAKLDKTLADASALVKSLREKVDKLPKTIVENDDEAISPDTTILSDSTIKTEYDEAPKTPSSVRSELMVEVDDDLVKVCH